MQAPSLNTLPWSIFAHESLIYGVNELARSIKKTEFNLRITLQVNNWGWPPCLGTKLYSSTENKEELLDNVKGSTENWENRVEVDDILSIFLMINEVNKQ